MGGFCNEHQYAYSGDDCPGCNHTDGFDVSNVSIDTNPPNVDMSSYWEYYEQLYQRLDERVFLFAYGVSDFKQVVAK